MEIDEFNYTAAKVTLYSIPVGMNTSVEVVGDPDNCSYEWIHRTDNRIDRHSDDGYGMAQVALRDGLIAYLGMPK